MLLVSKSSHFFAFHHCIASSSFWGTAFRVTPNWTQEIAIITSQWCWHSALSHKLLRQAGAICHVRGPLVSCKLWRLHFWYTNSCLSQLCKVQSNYSYPWKDNGKIMNICWSHTIVKFKHNITEMCKSFLMTNFLCRGYHIFLTTCSAIMHSQLVIFVSHILLNFFSNLECFASFSYNC